MTIALRLLCSPAAIVSSMLTSGECMHFDSCCYSRDTLNPTLKPGIESGISNCCVINSSTGSIQQTPGTPSFPCSLYTKSKE
jgi:hypothetical protein